jgi:hypothetical protein
LTGLLRGIAELLALFPPDSGVLTECIRHGVGEVRLKDGGIFRIAASYDPEEKAIEIDPGIDREKIAAEISRRHGIAVKPGEVHLWMFLHELGHHLRRERLLGRRDRNVLFSPTPRNLEEERQAEAYAKRRFIEWRKSLEGKGRVKDRRFRGDPSLR